MPARSARTSAGTAVARGVDAHHLVVGRPARRPASPQHAWVWAKPCTRTIRGPEPATTVCSAMRPSTLRWPHDHAGDVLRHPRGPVGPRRGPPRRGRTREPFDAARPGPGGRRPHRRAGAPRRALRRLHRPRARRSPPACRPSPCAPVARRRRTSTPRWSRPTTPACPLHRVHRRPAARAARHRRPADHRPGEPLRLGGAVVLRPRPGRRATDGDTWRAIAARAVRRGRRRARARPPEPARSASRCSASPVSLPRARASGAPCTGRRRSTSTFERPRPPPARGVDGRA